jgi:hypothetical protein
MQDPLIFYNSERQRFELRLSLLKKQLTISSFLRLAVFIGSVVSIYLFFDRTWVVLIILSIGITLFLYLISRHSNLDYQKAITMKLVEINTVEIAVLNGDYLSLNEGGDYIDPKHFYSYDIDLFGRGSFFQYCNRTVTTEGEKELSDSLTQNTIEDVITKQEGIKELTKTPKWRQQFSSIASLVKVDFPVKEIVLWIDKHKKIIPDHLLFLPLLFSVLSIGIIVLVSFQVLNFQLLVLWFFIGLGISGLYIKKINKLYENASKAKDTFRQNSKLLNLIEKAKFSSQILRDKQQSINEKSLKASLIFAQFSKTLDALDQRNNLLIAFIGNGLFLWDMQQSINIEKWIKKYKEKVETWFNVITFFDAQISLATFAFNHPDFVYPEIDQSKSMIKAQNLGHPLLNKKLRVSNHFAVEDNQFFIITGANMAGKSTFLRTVALAVVMANAGLPVCAKAFYYKPVKLITSMRTSDSLTDEESYFFSELKRLKFIVDEIKNDKYLIILDEILKGTNSTDKSIGSKKFLKKLTNSGATGLIATHDLSLCETEKDISAVRNFYFDAEIVNDELHFDYQLKKGICKNMNASFLLKKMEII